MQVSQIVVARGRPSLLTGPSFQELFNRLEASPAGLAQLREGLEQKINGTIEVAERNLEQIVVLHMSESQE